MFIAVVTDVWQTDIFTWAYFGSCDIGGIFWIFWPKYIENITNKLNFKWDKIK